MGLVNNLTVTTEEIVEYLCSHPDFFHSHPGILAELEIPHDGIGNASSLIEYQVHRLQEQVRNLRSCLDESDLRIDRNRRFSASVHKLVLGLQTTRDITGLYTTLNSGLRSLYQADRVLLLIFGSHDAIPDLPDLRFLESGSRISLMFTEIMHRNKPLCGSLQEEHLLTLFGNDIEGIRSTVIIPLQQESRGGLLVLGSGMANRYSHGFELDSLLFVAGFCNQLIHSRSGGISAVT